MSRSSSEKQWDVAALAKLTSLFLSSQEQDTLPCPRQARPGCTPSTSSPAPNSKANPEDSVLSSQAALANALSAALLGTQQGQAGEEEAPVASKRQVGSKTRPSRALTLLPSPRGSPGGRCREGCRSLQSVCSSTSSPAPAPRPGRGAGWRRRVQ